MTHIYTDQVPVNARTGYTYQRLISHNEGDPYNALLVKVSGRHSKRRVVHGIRNYFVISGTGTFTIDGEELIIKEGDLLVIHPDESYSYEGFMWLFEFNIAIDGKIEHEDLE